MVAKKTYFTGGLKERENLNVKFIKKKYPKISISGTRFDLSGLIRAADGHLK